MNTHLVNQLPARLLGWLAMVLLSLTVINYIPVLAQIVVLGTVYAGMGPFKAALTVLFLIYIAIGRGVAPNATRLFDFDRRLFWFALLFALYRSAQLGLLTVNGVIDSSSAGYILNAWLPYLMLPLVALVPGIDKKPGSYGFQSFLAICVVGLGIAQFITDSPIIPLLEDEDNIYTIWTERFGGEDGRYRSMSLFRSHPDYSSYLTFIAGFVIGFAKRTENGEWVWSSRRRLSLIFGALLVISTAAFATTRRGTWVELCFGLTCGALILIFPKIGRRLHLFLPALFLPLILGVIYFVQSPQSFQNSGLFSAESMHMRMEAWSQVGVILDGQNINQWLFGTGFQQEIRTAFGKQVDLLVDNGFLIALLDMGLVGVVLLLLVMLQMTRVAIRIYYANPCPILLGAALALATFVVRFSLESAINNFPLYLIYGLLAARFSSPLKRTDLAPVIEETAPEISLSYAPRET